MGVIGGSIERIDDPTVRSRGLAGLIDQTGFFSQNCVVRIPGVNFPDDQRFAFPVRNRYEVGSAFVLNLLVPTRIVAQNFAGGPGNIGRKIQIFHSGLSADG